MRGRGRNIYGEILTLGLPILVGQLGMIVVAFADNIMVGRYTTEALASASFVNNVFNVAIFASLGFTYGLTPLAGALYGRGALRDIGATVRRALSINLVFTAAIMALMAVIYVNVDNMGQDAGLLPLIRPYFLIMLAGMVPVCIFNVLAQWSYAIGNSRMPMWIILATNIINIAGNYALIYGHWGAPELGLTGAGIATLASRVLGTAAIVTVFFRARANREYARGYAGGTKTAVPARKIWRTSLPIALQMTFESGSFTISAIMAGWIGKIELAAFQIIVIIGTLGFCIYYSIGAALTVKVANASADTVAPHERMRSTAGAGYRIMLVIMTLSSVIFAVFGRDLMHAFTEDTRVLSVAYTLILPLVLYQLGDATQITFANALRGTSHVMPILWVAFFSYVVVGLPVTYILAFPAGLGLWGIILSFSASLFMAGALFLYFFMRATRAPHAKKQP